MPMYGYPNDHDSFMLYCDASNYAGQGGEGDYLLELYPG